jgi:hypothetical protein
MNTVITYLDETINRERVALLAHRNKVDAIRLLRSMFYADGTAIPRTTVDPFAYALGRFADERPEGAPGYLGLLMAKLLVEMCMSRYPRTCE